MDMMGNMDVGFGTTDASVRQTVPKAEFSNRQSASNTASVPANGCTPSVDVQISSLQGQMVENEQDKNKKNVENPQQLDSITKAMNEFMDKMCCDIKFQIHQETKRLMVQVVSQKDGKVLKEFPPKEMLDVLANISKNIGLILDKKA